MARPERTFRPADLEEDAPPPYAATAPASDSTVPDPQQYQQAYPALDTSYIVQQQQQQHQLQEQLSAGLPSTPPPPIHYYPVMSSSAPTTGHTPGSTTTTTTVAPPPLQYPQYPVISTAVGATAVGVSPYPMYPGVSQSTVYPAPQAYPVMGGGSGLPSPYGPAATPAGPGAPAAHIHSHTHRGGGSAYPVPYPTATGMPPTSHHGGQHFSHHQHYPASPLQFAPPPGSPAASTATASTSTTALPHFSPSGVHVVAPQPHPQQQQPVLVSSTPNVAVTTPTVTPTAPEEKLIDLDDIDSRWDHPEPPRAPHVYTSPVFPAMSAIAVLSPTPAPAPVSGVPQTGVATSPSVPLPYMAPPVPQQVPPPTALPDLVTLYKCRRCGATLDSDTAVCKRIHVGGFSGDKQANQATEADLNERRKLITHANGSGAGASPSNRSSSTVGSQGSGESAVYDSNHGTSDVYLNHRQYNRSRRSEELALPAHIVSPPPFAESSSSGGALGRATSMVNPSSTHQYHSTASTNDNHGTNDVYIRRSFSTQNPVTSLKKLWRDTKKELLTIQQPPYSSRNHELVAPPPLPSPMMQEQPYPQPPEQYQPSPMYHHHLPGAVPQQQHHGHVGYPVLSSSTTPATNSTIPAASTNPFDDPPTPAYNPAHAPVYVPDLPMRTQQQQQQSLPAPSAPPSSHPW
ncbi:MAG: hypothetical protein JOS17DRAFT_728470 [Linnemannia elongata]|nr:MAG: hypothetical protein JOS17DRAFT_728470 [Linnemannia elongata]